MSTLYIEPACDSSQVLHLVRAAVKSQITKLELGLEMAKKRLTPFEQKYSVTSERFMAEMTAEDLKGGDQEYVQWAGEYKLKQRLEQKLQQLLEINYSD